MARPNIIASIAAPWQPFGIEPSAHTVNGPGMGTRIPEEVGLRRRTQAAQGAIETSVDGAIAVRAAMLPDFHTDPADRLGVDIAKRSVDMASSRPSRSTGI